MYMKKIIFQLNFFNTVNVSSIPLLKEAGVYTGDIHISQFY